LRGLLLDHGEEHAELFDRELFGRGLVEDVTAKDAKVQGLVSDLALESVGKVEEGFDQISVKHLSKPHEVDLSLDMSSPEQIVVAPRLSIAVAIS